MPIYGGKALCAGSTSQFYVIPYSCWLGLAKDRVFPFFLAPTEPFRFGNTIAEDVIKKAKKLAGMIAIRVTAPG